MVKQIFQSTNCRNSLLQQQNQDKKLLIYLKLRFQRCKNNNFTFYFQIIQQVSPVPTKKTSTIMGSLSSHGLKGRIGLEWSQLKTPTGTLIKNNYSQQQFHIFSIPELQINNLKLYFLRQFSSLPKTPKVICIQKHPDHLLVLVEKADKYISSWLAEIHCQLSILLKLKDMLSAISALKNKFGPFLITDKMIKISANDNLLVWYNQRYESNLIQLPLIKQDIQGQNQLIMLQNVIEIFRKSPTKNFNINPLIPIVKNFSQFKIKVKSRIQEIQFLLGSKTQSQQSIKLAQTNEHLMKQQHQPSQKLISERRTHNQCSQLQKFIHNNNKSTHDNKVRIINTTQVVNQCFKKQKRHISFLLDEAHKSQQKLIMNNLKRNQKPLSSLEQQSSQSSSSPHVSSRQKQQKVRYDADRSKFSKTFNSIASLKYHEKSSQTNLFKKHYPILNSDMFDDNINQLKFIKINPCKAKKQDIPTIQATSHKSNQSSILYKGCDSFSSKKTFSLQSTIGTLKKTRQFQQSIRQILQRHQTIKEESDQTHKNSNNYSVESIKEDLKQQMKGSVSLSQDFNKLFSMGDSVASGMQDSMREKQFQKILFGHY